MYFLLAGRDICVDDPSLDMDMLADVMNSQRGPELPQGVCVSEAAKDFLACCLQVIHVLAAAVVRWQASSSRAASGRRLLH